MTDKDNRDLTVPQVVGISFLIMLFGVFVMVGGIGVYGNAPVNVEDSGQISSVSSGDIMTLSLAEHGSDIVFVKPNGVKSVDVSATVYYTDNMNLYIGGVFGKAMSNIGEVKHRTYEVEIGPDEDRYIVTSDVNRSFAFIGINGSSQIYNWAEYLWLMGLVIILVGMGILIRVPK